MMQSSQFQIHDFLTFDVEVFKMEETKIMTLKQLLFCFFGLWL